MLRHIGPGNQNSEALLRVRLARRMGAREGIEGGAGRVGRQDLRQMVDGHIEPTRIGHLPKQNGAPVIKRSTACNPPSSTQCRYQASTSAWLRPNGPFK